MTAPVLIENGFCQTCHTWVDDRDCLPCIERIRPRKGKLIPAEQPADPYVEGQPDWRWCTYCDEWMERETKNDPFECPECHSTCFCLICKTWWNSSGYCACPEPRQEGMAGWPLWKGFLFFYFVALPIMMLIMGAFFFVVKVLACDMFGGSACR